MSQIKHALFGMIYGHAVVPAAFGCEGADGVTVAKAGGGKAGSRWGGGSAGVRFVLQED